MNLRKHDPPKSSAKKKDVPVVRQFKKCKFILAALLVSSLNMFYHSMMNKYLVTDLTLTTRIEKFSL